MNALSLYIFWKRMLIIGISIAVLTNSIPYILYWYFWIRIPVIFVGAGTAISLSLIAFSLDRMRSAKKS
jgi:uncharacterized membrane protein YgaE (UPF0421/DUF939 family)